MVDAHEVEDRVRKIMRPSAFDAIILPNSPTLSPPFIPMNGIPWGLAAAWQSVRGDSSPRGAAATLGTVGETGTAFQVDAIEDARNCLPVGETGTADAQVDTNNDAPTGGPVGETGTADALVAEKDLARTGVPVVEKGAADALVGDDDNRVEQQGKGRKGRDRKRTPKDQRKSPPEDILGETGTADAQEDVDVEDHDKSDRGEQQGGKEQGKGKRDRANRKDKVGHKPTSKRVKRRVIESDESKSNYDPKESSDDKDDKKKARSDANKPKDRDKKQGNQAINNVHRRGQEKEP